MHIALLLDILFTCCHIKQFTFHSWSCHHHHWSHNWLKCRIIYIFIFYFSYFWAGIERFKVLTKTLHNLKFDSYSTLICIGCITFLPQNWKFIMYPFVVNDHVGSCLCIPEVQSQFRQMEIFLLQIQVNKFNYINNSILNLFYR
jgi:hypothetical protein